MERGMRGGSLSLGVWVVGACRRRAIIDEARHTAVEVPLACLQGTEDCSQQGESTTTHKAPVSKVVRKVWAHRLH